MEKGPEECWGLWVFFVFTPPWPRPRVMLTFTHFMMARLSTFHKKLKKNPTEAGLIAASKLSSSSPLPVQKLLLNGLKSHFARCQWGEIIFRVHFVFRIICNFPKRTAITLVPSGSRISTQMHRKTILKHGIPGSLLEALSRQENS